MERAALDGDPAQALERAESMLGILSDVEPATSLERRELLASVELRVLSLIEREAASGRLKPADLARLDQRISARNIAPDPEVEGLLMVAEWAERTRIAAISDAAAQASLDPRFWRDLYPRIRTVRRLLEEQRSTNPPASVALARYWRTSRRVGELPPQIGVSVSVSPGEASLILDFCEEHRQLTWRRIATLSALRLEAYRQKTGAFPDLWKHSVPGGATMELVKERGPLLRLTDNRDQLRSRIPYWLAPASLPMPPSTPALDYDCLLFGAPPVPTLTAH
jgi:hypothetical protein